MARGLHRCCTMSGKLKSLLFGGDASMSIATDISITVFRVFIGLAMAFAHGIGKVPPSEGFINKVGEIGFPLPTLFAWGAGLAEFVCGITLALGLLTRVSAFFLAFTLGVAAFVVKGPDIMAGDFKTAELALLFFFGYIVFLFSGSGRIAVDKFFRG